MENGYARPRFLINLTLTALILLAAVTTIASAGTRGPLAPGFSWDHVIGIKNTQNIRVVYGIKNDVWEAGVGKPLFYARGLYESYDAMGIDSKNVDMHLVLHGAAGYWLLNDAAYSKYKDTLLGNPNKHVIKGLLEKGAHIEACYETLKGHGWKPEDFLPGVTVVHDAYSRIIDLQLRGYAYIPFF